MTTQKYTQCELVKTLPNGVIKQISYIPSQFAIKDNILKLNGEDGWKVTWTSQFEVDVLPDVKQVVRRHKKNTGDSLPK